jgi:hypothetical protein
MKVPAAQRTRLPNALTSLAPRNLSSIYVVIVSPAPGEIVGEGRPWTVPMISLPVDALEVDAGDTEVGVSELALDHHGPRSERGVEEGFDGGSR